MSVQQIICRTLPPSTLLWERPDAWLGIKPYCHTATSFDEEVSQPTSHSKFYRANSCAPSPSAPDHPTMKPLVTLSLARSLSVPTHPSPTFTRLWGTDFIGYGVHREGWGMVGRVWGLLWLASSLLTLSQGLFCLLFSVQHSTARRQITIHFEGDVWRSPIWTERKRKGFFSLTEKNKQTHVCGFREK